MSLNVHGLRQLNSLTKEMALICAEWGKGSCTGVTYEGAGRGHGPCVFVSLHYCHDHFHEFVHVHLLTYLGLYHFSL